MIKFISKVYYEHFCQPYSIDVYLIDGTIVRVKFDSEQERDEEFAKIINEE